MSDRPISEDDLNGFVDKRLEARRRAEVGAYLQAHPDVASRVASMCAQHDILQRAFAHVAQEPLPPELTLASTSEPQRFNWRLSPLAVAAAAVLSLCLGGIGGWSLHDLSAQPTTGIAALAREATASYVVYAADQTRPVEVRDRAQLVAWLAQRLGRSVAVPDLALAGYRFMGGRIVATAHGPAALLMYDNDRDLRLVMLMRPMLREQAAPMARYAAGPINGYSWADKGLGYSLVGVAAPAVLHPLADEARRQIAGTI
jgi:anti-sigma factor RsiW